MSKEHSLLNQQERLWWNSVLFEAPWSDSWWLMYNKVSCIKLFKKCVAVCFSVPPVLLKQQKIYKNASEGQSIILSCKPPQSSIPPHIHWMDKSESVMFEFCAYLTAFVFLAVWLLAALLLVSLWVTKVWLHLTERPVGVICIAALHCRAFPLKQMNAAPPWCFWTLLVISLFFCHCVLFLLFFLSFLHFWLILVSLLLGAAPFPLTFFPSVCLIGLRNGAHQEEWQSDGRSGWEALLC